MGRLISLLFSILFLVMAGLSLVRKDHEGTLLFMGFMALVALWMIVFCLLSIDERLDSANITLNGIYQKDVRPVVIDRQRGEMKAQ
jgi:Na+/melibiose symporter-like transporter